MVQSNGAYLSLGYSKRLYFLNVILLKIVESEDPVFKTDDQKVQWLKKGCRLQFAGILEELMFLFQNKTPFVDSLFEIRKKRLVLYGCDFFLGFKNVFF